MKKLISIIIIAVISISAYKFFTDGGFDKYLNQDTVILLTEGTDDDKIMYTIEKFEESYNNGNFNNMAKCCNGRVRASLKAQMGIFSGVINGLLGKFLSFSLGNDIGENIWTLGTETAQLYFDVEYIYYFSNTSAEVTLKITDKGNVYPAYLELEKENELWYISSDFYQYSKA